MELAAEDTKGIVKTEHNFSDSESYYIVMELCPLGVKYALL